MRNFITNVSILKQELQPGAILLNRKQISRSRFRDKLEKRHERNVELLTAYAEAEMNNRRLPDLRSVCYDLVKTFSGSNYPFNALQFVPVLRNIRLSKIGINQILKNQSTSHARMVTGIPYFTKS